MTPNDQLGLIVLASFVALTAAYFGGVALWLRRSRNARSGLKGGTWSSTTTPSDSSGVSLLFMTTHISADTSSICDAGTS